jgi:hypothetical protein
MWKGEWKFYVFIWPGGMFWLFIALVLTVTLVGLLPR